jgi:hypothetical protein
MKLFCGGCGKLKKSTEFYSDTSERGYFEKCKKCFQGITRKKKTNQTYCRWCFGYGVFAGDGRPIGMHEMKQLFPAQDCKYCGANYQMKKKGVVNPDNNPTYPW